MTPALTRFIAKVAKEPNDGCWRWTASRIQHPCGVTYGHFHLDGRVQAAHRASWQMFVGPIPVGLKVLHRCDNPACVNPDHLFLGTQLDNVHDMAAKGRARKRALKGEDSLSAKLKAVDVVAIRASRERGGLLARRYGISHSSICDIRARRTWDHIP